MRDRFGRTINYLRLSLTDRCNYNCRYCKPDLSLPDTHENESQLTDDEIIKIIESIAGMGIHKIRLTGGEPLIRKGIVNLVRRIHNVKGVREVVMTSNASLLSNQLPLLKKAGLKRVNISLDTLDPSKFAYITQGGKLSSVLKSIDQLLELNMKPVKLNVVLMKGINDDEIEDFVELTKDKEVIVRFIELMPIGSESFSFRKHYLSNDEILSRCPKLYMLNNTNHISETAQYYKLPHSKGKVGLISAISQHFCSSCNRIRITSDGKVKTCLHENHEYDLLSYMRTNEGRINDFLSFCIDHKPKSHKINQSDFQKVKRSMYKIGG